MSREDIILITDAKTNICRSFAITNPNLKHSQREAMTKERQSRLMTGGGPVSPPAQLDPDIAAIGKGSYIIFV
jgi:hypothetical protein